MTSWGIDIIINPERAAALEMAKIIRTPNVKSIDYYANGKVQIICLNVEEKSYIANKKIHEIPLPSSCNVVAIIRNSGEVIIPGGNDVIAPGDDIYVLGETGILSDIGWLISEKRKILKT